MSVFAPSLNLLKNVSVALLSSKAAAFKVSANVAVSFVFLALLIALSKVSKSLCITHFVPIGTLEAPTSTTTPSFAFSALSIASSSSFPSLGVAGLLGFVGSVGVVGFASFDTVTTQVAVFFPSAVVTVTVAVPSATPVTRPLLDTVAILLLSIVHVTFLFVAFEGCTFAVSWTVFPAPIPTVIGLGVIVTPVTFTVVVVSDGFCIAPIVTLGPIVVSLLVTSLSTFPVPVSSEFTLELIVPTPLLFVPKLTVVPSEPLSKFNVSILPPSVIFIFDFTSTSTVLILVEISIGFEVVLSICTLSIV